MKYIPLLFLLIVVQFLTACSGTTTEYYYKCFFVTENSFYIEGTVFINDDLTEKHDFEEITVKTDSVRGWEIEGSRTAENTFRVRIDTSANGKTLSKDIIVDHHEAYSHIFPDDFKYCSVTFYIDGRKAKGAVEPDFNEFYYFIYVPEKADLSSTDYRESSGVFGTDHHNYYYDLNFAQPGWYKLYYSQDNPIGNNQKYSSGAGTKIRSPK